VPRFKTLRQMNDLSIHEIFGFVALLFVGSALVLSDLAVIFIFLAVPCLACYVLGECGETTK
jgi:hypothetical protein